MAVAPERQPPSLREVKRRLSSSSTQRIPIKNNQATITIDELGSSPEGRNRLNAINEGSDQSATFDDDSDLPEDDVVDQRERDIERGRAGAGLWKETAIKSGYLFKKGERRHAWKKRYFVLRPKRFGYYKDEKEYKLLRDIPLLDIRTCAEVSVKKHDNVFGIVTNSRTYYVQATTAAEVDDWVAKIYSTARAAKRAKEEEASSSVTEEGVATPIPGDATPVSKVSSKPVQVPIQTAISSPMSSSYVSNTPSYSTSQSSISIPTSPISPVSGSDTVASSFASTSSNTYNMPMAIPAANTHRQSVSVASALQAPEMSKVDQSLSAMSIGSSDASQSVARTYSTAGSSVLPMTTPISDRQQSYFSQPGLASSSDEDEDEDEVPPTPSSPLGLSPLSNLSPQTLQAFGKARSGEPDKIIMSGYLTKQGKRKTWRKRWFSLTSTRLCYSRSHMDTKILRQIPLNRMLDVMEYEPSSSGGLGLRGNRTTNSSADAQYGSPLSQDQTAERLKAYQHCFQIITPKKTLKLCATDEDCEIKWISAIRVCLAASRRMSLSPPPQTLSLPHLVEQPPTPTPRSAPLVSEHHRAAGDLPSIEGQLSVQG